MEGLTTPRALPAAVVQADGWAVTWQPSPGAAVRLFCLPHTGGGAAVYRQWAGLLAPDVEVVAIRLPGRECRLREQPYSRMEDLVAQLVERVGPLLDRPHAWFGHSMGALIAFEVCRALRRRGLPEPVRLLVSGRRAPHLTGWEPPVHAAPHREVMERLRLLNGTPPEILDDAAMMSALLPVLRADFAVSERYRYTADRPLDCPITALGGTDDPMAGVPELSAWREHTRGDFTAHVVEGDHFFLHTSRESVMPRIRESLRHDTKRGTAAR